MIKIPLEACAFNYLYLTSADRRLRGVEVARIRKYLAKALAEEISKHHRYDAVIPIPNTGIVYGRELAICLGVPCLEIFSAAKEFQTLGMEAQDRHDFYKNYLAQHQMLASAQCPLFVDETIISGNTIKSISSWCADVEIEKWGIGICSPPVIGFCPQRYIPTEDRLFENNSSEIVVKNGLLDFLSEDIKIHFLEHSKFLNIFAEIGACTACFSTQAHNHN